MTHRFWREFGILCFAFALSGPTARADDTELDRATDNYASASNEYYKAISGKNLSPKERFQLEKQILGPAREEHSRAAVRVSEGQSRPAAGGETTSSSESPEPPVAHEMHPTSPQGRARFEDVDVQVLRFPGKAATNATRSPATDSIKSSK